MWFAVEGLAYHEKWAGGARRMPAGPRYIGIAESLDCGTELTIVQEGLPEAIPVEMCYLGWQESLLQLAKLVEPDIPG